MRLFLAFDIDANTRAQLAAAREEIQRVVDQAPVPPRVTWVKDEAAHVTLRFIGETAAERVRTIQDALTSLSFAPFELPWERIGTFGGTRNPRVIWIAPASGSDACTALVVRISAHIDPILGPAEERPFKPHLTLGRVREPGRGVDWTRALSAVRWNPSVTRVEHIVLYQSRLSPKGPTYTALSTHG